MSSSETTERLSREEHQNQIAEYSKKRHNYELYAQLLERVLNKGCQNSLPEAVIEARAKTVSSFAEKCVRKFPKVKDAVIELTDLCGVRVIVQTLSQVEAVRRFIEKNFTIIETEDIGLRLGEKEFGYRDRHYIIQLNPERAASIGITTGEISNIGGLKAEVQIRTWAQHAWADTLHDRTYKTPLKLTTEDHRTSALLAALMEDGDINFDRLSSTLDARVANYAAFAPVKALEEEIDIQKLILENEPNEQNKPGIALRLARLYIPLLRYKEAIELLTKWAESSKGLQNEFDFELGTALCLCNRAFPDSSDYRSGRGLLENLANRLETFDYTSVPNLSKFTSLRAHTNAQLARAWERDPNEYSKARPFYRKAFEIEPENPYYLADMLGFELHCSPNSQLAEIQLPYLHKAIHTCEEHAEAGIELPFAYFTLGRFYLLLKKPEKALQNYLRGAHHCFDSTTCFGREVIDAEISWLHRVNHGKELPPEYQHVKEFLCLAKGDPTSQTGCSQSNPQDVRRRPKLNAPVLILAGGAASIKQESIALLRKPLTTALQNFSGTVIAGGTRSGIPGLAGDIAEFLKKNGSKNFQLVGYRPNNFNMDKDAPEDNRYDDAIHVGETEFNAKQILANWTDILAAGIEPKMVRLIGIGGGPLAAVEYRVALVLGASVAVIKIPKQFTEARDAVDEILADPQWNQFKNLLPLPLDAATIRAFLIDSITSQEVKNKIEEMAKEFHDQYRKSNLKKIQPDNLKHWEHLPETYKKANREQAAYAVHILQVAGFGVRKVDGKPNIIIGFTELEIELMAELEHGRWNVERLVEGWKYGPISNAQLKITPHLTSWNKLEDSMKEYDRRAIVSYPKTLAEQNYEIYKLPVKL